MKLSLKIAAALSMLSALVVAPMIVGAGSASAQPARFDGSYVGGGVSGAVTNGGTNAGPNFGGNIQGRLAVPKAPVSLRTTVLFSGNNSAIVPTLSYDFAVNKNTNIYAGAGYSFVQKDGVNSPIGNKDAAVLQAGVESEVSKGIVVYSDAKYGINAYQGNNRGSVSLQGGVGLRF